MDFVSGDGVQLAITGAAAYGTVTLVETKNGSPYCPCPWTAGTTDGSGNFALTGTETDIHVAEYTEQWYVNGVAIGPLLDFEVVYKPDYIVPTSVNYTALGPRCPVSWTWGIEIDITYQIKNSSGQNVTTQTGIPFEPTELVSFDGGSLVGGDVGPVTGYSTSSKYATDGGVFHDVPVGACWNQGFHSTIDQTLYIEIGNATPQVRRQFFDVYSNGANHGSISNGVDVVKTR